MPTNDLTVYQPSENTQLSTVLSSLEDQLRSAAARNIGDQIDRTAYQDIEIRAMETAEACRLVNGVELAAVLMRGKFILQIEDEGLWANHPSGSFTRVQDMSEQLGISASEISNIRDLCLTIFPFIENVLGVPVAQMWERLGKSKFRELVPVMKYIITGEDPNAATVRGSVEHFMNNAAASLQAAGEAIDEDQANVRRQAINDLLEAGEMMPTQRLRDHVRNNQHTTALDPTIVEVDGNRYFLAKIQDDEQLVTMRRKLGGTYGDAIVANLAANPRQRQAEATRVAILRELFDFINGD